MTRRLALILALLLLMPLSARPAGAAGPPRLALESSPAGAVFRLDWPAPAGPALATAAPPAPSLLALALPAGVSPLPRLLSLSAEPWAGPAPAPLADAPPPRLTPDGEFQPLAGLAAPPGPPVAPVVLLREGRMRGVRVAVYAVSPVYLEGGAPRRVAALEALVPGAAPLPALAELLAAPGPLLAQAPPAPRAPAPGWEILVGQAGVQRLSAAALAAAGVDLGQVGRLRLERRGQEIPLQELRGPGGTLQELRFYAPPPGDRWNAVERYRLALGASPGLRMAPGPAGPAGAAPSPTLLERGQWRPASLYESRLPGPDGDRFFAADLRTAPPVNGQLGQPAAVAADLAGALAAAGGALALTVAGDTPYDGSHRLRVSVAGQNQEVSWSGAGPWQHSFSFAAVPAGQALAASVALLPRDHPDGDRVLVDHVAWERPAAPELGGQGAALLARAGAWRYQLAGLPASAALYDVSDPQRPQALALAGGAFSLEADAPRALLLAGPGTIHEPPLAAAIPHDLRPPRQADIVYIAPAAMAGQLQPLIDHRAAQGLRATVVLTEAIYAGWSWGHTDPESIRSFLRYAASTWPGQLRAAVLVGDGTADPRNYLGRNNTNWLPPYLAVVDPWLGETACEACYAQLDGDSPQDDPLPDLLIGRLPAKSPAELAGIVAKLVGYEQAGPAAPWRQQVALVADNADQAGDFAQQADDLAATLPAGVEVARLYYDPQAPADQPWRERDPLLALERTQAALAGGAGVLVYSGHGLLYQWGYTSPPLLPGQPTDRQFMLGLYSVDERPNTGGLPILLAMTCLTGAFQTPAFSGTTIDERLVALPDRGVAAAWSSTGLGVRYGHDALEEGFFRELWSRPGAALGELTLAGYLELFIARSCCQESLWTFALLGDPMTPVLMRDDLQRTRLPFARR